MARASTAARIVAVLCCLLAVAGLRLWTGPASEGPEASIPGPEAADPATSAPAPQTAVAAAPRNVPLQYIGEPAAPRTIRIPRLKVDAPITGVGLADDGAIAVPPPEAAGWYEGSPSPGANGPAVILGHVDSKSGPAVFYRLSAMRTGDAIEIARDDGTVVRFSVSKVARYRRAAVPAEVHAITPVPSLRLITCGGPYDLVTGYRDNIVVYADRVA